MKTIITYFLFFSPFALINCSADSIELKEEETLDLVSGTFYLTGARTSSGFSCFNCIVDEDPYINTTSFAVNVQMVKGKQDTVRFFGIHGADVGESDKRVFPDCTASDDCKVFGRLTTLEQFEIDIENNGRRFQATGVIRSVTFTLNGQYTHENRAIDYELEGKRVDF